MTILAIAATASRLRVASGEERRAEAIGMAMVVLLGVARTLRPPAWSTPGWAVAAAASVEAAFITTLVIFTGGWTSPLIAVFGGLLLLAGLFGGPSALGAALVAASATDWIAAGPVHVAVTPVSSWAGVVSTAVELLLLAAIGVALHRLLRRQDRVSASLQWANRLRSDLLAHEGGRHDAGLSGAAAVFSAALREVRTLLPCEDAALYVRDLASAEIADDWVVIARDEVSADAANEDLARAFEQHVRGRAATLVSEQGSFAVGSTRALYAPISVGGSLIGMLRVTSDRRRGFRGAEASMLDELARYLGLVLDQAQAALRSHARAAAAERGRIVRHLHDRVGASLAAAAFKIDELMATPSSDVRSLHGDLGRISAELRAATSEIRCELSELRRADEPGRDLVHSLQARLAESRLPATFDHGVEIPLTPRVAEEIRWVALEAIRNAEQHADARALAVVLCAASEGVRLEVRDDGRGFEPQRSRDDAFGLVGMRERAALVGGALSIESDPAGGTSVRLEIPGCLSDC